MKERLPLNIRRYKEKFIWVFSKRQALFTLLGLLTFLGVLALFWKLGLLSVAPVFATVASVPVFAFGFLSITGLPLEKVIGRIISENFSKSGFRPFKTEGYINGKEE